MYDRERLALINYPEVLSIYNLTLENVFLYDNLCIDRSITLHTIICIREEKL